MGRFGEALGEGVEAFRDSERALAEIREVLEDVSKDVNETTKGAVQVFRAKKLKLGFSFSATLELSLRGKLPPLEPFDALVAKAVLPPGITAGNSELRLADYDVSASGYPLSLTYSDTTEHAHDKESLVRVLIHMLKHPDTGRKIAMLEAVHRENKDKRPESKDSDGPRVP